MAAPGDRDRAQLQQAPHLPFSQADIEALGNNALVMRIQPDEGITLRFGAKVPATLMEIRDVTMDFAYGTRSQSPARGLRTADPGRAARRPAAVPAARGGRVVLEDPGPDPGVLGRSDTQPEGYPSGSWGRPAATPCSPATASSGGGHDAAIPTREAQMIITLAAPARARSPPPSCAAGATRAVQPRHGADVDRGLRPVGLRLGAGGEHGRGPGASVADPAGGQRPVGSTARWTPRCTSVKARRERWW